MPIGVAKQADNCYVRATRDFRHLEQRPSVRFWAGTLAGLAFWRVRLSEIVAARASGGNRAGSMLGTIFWWRRAGTS
jgi:hypothetical protein